jgi:CheY-like chemotaxis protein
MKKIRILIVEDEVISAMSLRMDLQARGYEVVGLSGTGEEALGAAEKSRPDLVLMDVNIRGGMNGIEVALKMRSAFSIPSIFMTGYLDQVIREKTRAAEPVGYFIKPVAIDELQTAIDAAMGKGG